MMSFAHFWYRNYDGESQVFPGPDSYLIGEVLGAKAVVFVVWRMQ